MFTTRHAISFRRLSRRQLIVHTGAGLVTLAPCSCLLRPAPAAEAWGYAEPWPGICTTGRQQSPINLPLPPDEVSLFGSSATVHSGPGSEVTLRYSTAAKLTVTNPGHGTMQVNAPRGSICSIGGHTLELLQWHFHNPSEHALQGRRLAMEAHLVHRNLSSGGLAVIGVLLQRGESLNSALQLALNNAPAIIAEPKETARPVNLHDMLGSLILPGGEGMQGARFVHYVGSLSTPPCTEGVDWFVMLNSGTVSDKQVADFAAFADTSMASNGQNARPLQSIGGRELDFH